jgi:DNA replicative helicase MCM subunit Mcm2 (Cdc46/Mcm family)
MIDAQSTEQDQACANFKLSYARQEEDLDEESKVAWPAEKLLKYIMYVQRFIDPVCTEQAEMLF